MVENQGARFYDRPLCVAGNGRSCGAPGVRIYSAQGYSRQTRGFGEYSKRIIVVLSNARLVSGVRGKGGGYRLTKKPSEYNVGNILRVLDETLALVGNSCPRADTGKTLPMWQKFNMVVNNFFGGISLEDLVECRISIDG